MFFLETVVSITKDFWDSARGETFDENAKNKKNTYSVLPLLTSKKQSGCGVERPEV